MRRARRESGFTLMEVAVTIVIVGIALLYVLDGLNTSMILAAHTRNQKVARDLGRATLAQVESGLLRDEIESGLVGTYAEEGFPEFNWELAVGDDALSDTSREDDGRYDSWAKTDAEKDAEDEDEDAEEPFEKVRVRVVFPKFAEFPNEVTLERWIPWAQVYGSAEGEDASKNPRAAKGKSGGGGSGSATSGAATSGAGSTSKAGSR